MLGEFGGLQPLGRECFPSIELVGPLAAPEIGDPVGGPAYPCKKKIFYVVSES